MPPARVTCARRSRRRCFSRSPIDEIDVLIRSLIDNDPTLRGKRELLTSVPGIGERLAVTILGELPNLSEFRTPRRCQRSPGFAHGVSIGKVDIGIVAVKAGNAHLRRMLYMPAVRRSAAIPSSGFCCSITIFGQTREADCRGCHASALGFGLRCPQVQATLRSRASGVGDVMEVILPSLSS